MKTPAILTNAYNTVTRLGSKLVLKGKKYSPELLIGAGVVAVVAGTIIACKQTLKVEEILDDHAALKEDINSAVANPDVEYTEEDGKHERAIALLRTTGRMAKLYAPAIGLEVLGISCFIASYGIMKKRNVALMAAYNSLDNAFKEYRKRVAAKIGDDVERELYHGLKVEEVVDEQTGEKKKVMTSADISPYAKCFDEFNSQEWHRDPNKNLMFLRMQEKFAQQKLVSQGHLFLNEVYDMLGFDRTSAGAIVGWIYDGDPTKVSFGIYDIDRPGGLGAADFVNGRTPSIWLDFNVDGVIYDLI